MIALLTYLCQYDTIGRTTMLGDRQMATIKEQKEKLAEQISKLQARYKQLDQKDKIQERKARTKRLIERGAMLESKLSERAILVMSKMPKEKMYNVDKWLIDHENIDYSNENTEVDNITATNGQDSVVGSQ